MSRRSSSRAPSTARIDSPSSCKSDGITAVPIHGNRSQPQRTKALADFKSGVSPDYGRDRHCRAGFGHRPTAARHQLRATQRPVRLRSPHRTNRTRRVAGRCDLARQPRGAVVPERHRKADPQAHRSPRPRRTLRLRRPVRSLSTSANRARCSSLDSSVPRGKRRDSALRAVARRKDRDPRADDHKVAADAPATRSDKRWVPDKQFKNNDAPRKNCVGRRCFWYRAVAPIVSQIALF